MYKLILTTRYLRRKLTPLFALFAVAGCTALVIIVLAVMGGFIDYLKTNGHTLIGDVSIHSGLAGFPYYNELTDKITQLPQAQSATPIIIAYGIAKFGNITTPVQLHGVHGAQYANTTQYANKIYWTQTRLTDENYQRVRQLYKTIDKNPQPIDPLPHAINLTLPWEVAGYNPAVLGIQINPYNERQKDGSYLFKPSIIQRPITITVLPITAQGAVTEPATRKFVAINEFHSGHIEADGVRIFVPFDLLQDMMNMLSKQTVRRGPDGEFLFSDTGQPLIDETKSIPARATELHVKASPNTTTEQLRAAVAQTVESFATTHPNLPIDQLQIQTWQQRNAKTIAAIENERVMMSILFGIISLVNVFLIGIMFYMIVLEKTHDIGILRALGAPAAGVRTIFLSFGATIGFAGAALGATFAIVIIKNINPLHDFLSNNLGITIYDKRVYFFELIPTRLQYSEVATIATIALIASILGALIPAIFAAKLDPIQALHQE